MDKDSENSNSPKSKDTQRAFGCPCGKTYLSYPALFTHVKQKHDGKAPGNLIKPKTGKIRGRPKTRIDPIDKELQEIMSRIETEIPRLVEEEIIEYSQDFKKSEGNLTCQDAASAFLDHFEGVIENGLSILNCFMNEVKNSVEGKLGVGFWEKEKPDEIIDIANDLYMNHERKISEFPISKKLLKELTFHFFEWLFAQKFTNHRLIRVQKDEKMCDVENENSNSSPNSEEDSDENAKNEEVSIKDVKISS